jgi:hypothetical protein
MRAPAAALTALVLSSSGCAGSGTLAPDGHAPAERFESLHAALAKVSLSSDFSRGGGATPELAAGPTTRGEPRGAAAEPAGGATARGEPRGAAAEPAAAVTPPKRTTADDEQEASAGSDPEGDPGAAGGPVLVATAKETLVYARPAAKAPKLGYLRSGAVVPRSAEPVSRDGCAGGFFEIAPEGFVCAGPAASIDPRHELARTGLRRPDRTAPLPYVYGLAVSADAPLYAHVPTVAEQRAAEPDLGERPPRAESFDDVPFDAVPWFLEGGASSIRVSGTRFSPRTEPLSRAILRTGFAFTSLFEAGGRRFGLTTDMAVVPLDRFRRVVPSRFHGLPLAPDLGLPVVFVRSKAAPVYSGDPEERGLRLERRLEFRDAVPVTGVRRVVHGTAYLETRSGEWIRDENLVRVDPLRELPAWAKGERTWIDVSIQKQTLVAYVGERPVFVTLVSTGKDGTGDPETTHSTVQGEFLIHTKHVTVTMDGDEVGDEFDLREVPYVQYFKDGFALHAAYWHDGFGTPRSHGCINLSPLDARYLFAFTEPHVPAAWHGAMSAHGTLVSIHP